MSGHDSSLNIPIALTTTSASTVSPESSVSVHVAVVSFQRARATPSPNRQCGRSPYLSAMPCMYARISGWVP